MPLATQFDSPQGAGSRQALGSFAGWCFPAEPLHAPERELGRRVLAPAAGAGVGG